MNQRELLILSIGVFFTIVAWMLIDIYHLNANRGTEKEIRAVGTIKFSVSDEVFKILNDRKE
jgi:hypothetical protein